MPSLAQLDQAVREFIGENPTDVVTVVVDASFGHRIDPAEVAAFEEAETAGEVVSPPAGAIGRGDAFLLRIAEKTGATVLSNDSFQEFHGEHIWLFDKGRLVGGKPVPGVGWIFMDRTPVRGAKSREVTKEAKRKKRAETDVTPKSTTGSAKAPVVAEAKAKSRPKAVDRAIARATEEVTEPKSAGAKRRRRGGAPPSEPVNEPLAFITFIAAHPLGAEVIGSVLEYSSHGAFVEADGARCYVPMSAMGDPAPRRAREAVTKGARVPFVVQAFDPPRRGIELALPGFAKIAGSPTAETVEAEITAESSVPAVPPRRRPPKAAASADGAAAPPSEESPAPGRRSRAKKAAAAEVAPEGPAPRRRAKAAVPDAPPVKKARAAKAASAPAPPEPASPALAVAEAKPARVRKTAPKAAAPAAKKAAARKSPVKKAPADKVSADKPSAVKVSAAKVSADKTPARKAAAKKAAAAKAPAKRTAAKKAGAGEPTGGSDTSA
jgi:hypothetical protein